jgi:hypothetical protein
VGFRLLNDIRELSCLMDNTRLNHLGKREYTLVILGFGCLSTAHSGCLTTDVRFLGEKRTWRLRAPASEMGPSTDITLPGQMLGLPKWFAPFARR